MSQREYVLEMQNITKEFPGVRALNNVSLRLRPGTVHALMGENGAGKSTLMKCLFGIYAKDSGVILHNGKEVNYTCTLDAINDGVAMIHQELYPEPHLSVQENVWIGRDSRILKGVTVGKGAIVALSAVVTHDVPPYTVVACNPARVVKQLTPPEMEA
jgi:ABC-type sugar transport system ATPase subunit